MGYKRDGTNFSSLRLGKKWKSIFSKILGGTNALHIVTNNPISNNATISAYLIRIRLASHFHPPHPYICQSRNHCIFLYDFLMLKGERLYEGEGIFVVLCVQGSCLRVQRVAVHLKEAFSQNIKVCLVCVTPKIQELKSLSAYHIF